MKILLLNQAFYPDQVATAQQISDLALDLTSRGHEVTVIADHRGYEDRTKKFLRVEEWKGIKIERVWSTQFGKSRIRFRVIDATAFFFSLFWKLLATPPQDLVISFTSPPLIGFLGTLFCKLKGGRSVQWLMDINPDAAIAVGYLKTTGFLARALNAVFDFTLHSASHVVVLDRWMKKKVIDHGAAPEKVVIAAPWAVFVPEKEGLHEKIQAFKKEWGLEDKFVVLFSGNHSVVHPLDTVLEAAEKLKNQKGIVFVFAGAGLRTKQVSDFKKLHQLENILQIPWQPREKVAASFGSADLHCVVMGEKMSGLVHLSKIYSVLASGKPFVFVGPTQSHVSDLEEGLASELFVEHGKADALSAAILTAQAFCPEEKEKIAERSFTQVSRMSLSKNLQAFYSAISLIPEDSVPEEGGEESLIAPLSEEA